MELFVTLLYFLAILGIAYVASRKNSNTSDYILGSRRFSPFVTAIAAGASDMSSWLMMGLPGAVYLLGLTQIWLPIGLIIGAYFNWRLVAKRLRIYSELTDNANTLPTYLAQRFKDNKGLLQVITAIAFIIFFTVYMASGFVGLGLLLKSTFNVSYHTGIIMGALIILFYSMVGGFIAVNWIDVFQGSLMFFALLFVPLYVFNYIGGESAFTPTTLSSDFFLPLHGMTFWGVVSLLAWGLGYFGQPHILVRFMATKNPHKLGVARRIGMTWMVLSLIGAVGVGIVGAVIFPHGALAKPETVLIALSNHLLIPLLGGVLLAAVLSAAMSTAAAQVLVSASALVEDVLLRYCIKHPKNPKVEMNYNRLAVLLITVVAIGLAYNPHNTVLGLVAFGWAGLGAAFGPVILLSLFWSRMSIVGAIYGVVLGMITVLVWHYCKTAHGIFSLYEIIPGFLASTFGVWLGSTLKPIRAHVLEQHQAFLALLNSNKS